MNDLENQVPQSLPVQDDIKKEKQAELKTKLNKTKKSTSLNQQEMDSLLLSKSPNRLHKDWPVRLTAVWILQVLAEAFANDKIIYLSDLKKYDQSTVSVALSCLQWNKRISIQNDVVSLKP